MKAFIMSLVALVVISSVAAVSLSFVPGSAEQTYIDNRNVRL